jgi:hypothetical protein
MNAWQHNAIHHPADKVFRLGVLTQKLQVRTALCVGRTKIKEKYPLHFKNDLDWCYESGNVASLVSAV